MIGLKMLMCSAQNTLDKLNQLCIIMLARYKSCISNFWRNASMNEYKILFGFATVDFNENIGIVVDETDDYIILKKAYTLLKQPNSSGSMSVAFIPFMMSAGVGEGNKVKVNKAQIAWSMVEPDIDENLVNNYITQTTGLVVAGTDVKSATSKLLVK